MTTLYNGPDQLFKPVQEVIRIRSGGIAPVPITSSGAILGWRDVHSSKLGADDRRPGLMLGAWIGKGGLVLSSVDWLHKHLMLGLWRQDAVFHAGACCGKFRRVAVVVVGGKVCEDVLPATIVVNWPGRVKSSGLKSMFSSIDTEEK